MNIIYILLGIACVSFFIYYYTHENFITLDQFNRNAILTQPPEYREMHKNSAMYYPQKTLIVTPKRICSATPWDRLIRCGCGSDCGKRKPRPL